MRAHILLAAVVLIAACSKAPAGTPEAGATPTEEADAEADTKPAPSCADARAALDAMEMPNDMHQRVLESDVAKLGGALWPKVVTTAPPLLLLALAEMKTNAVCDLVFDIDEAGIARTPQAHCSDPAFEEDAVNRLNTMRFEPFELNGRALPVSGILMPMEYCDNA